MPLFKPSRKSETLKKDQVDWHRFKQDVYEKLYFGVQHAYGNDVAGDIAEFGTMSGETAQVLAQAVAACEKNWVGHITLSKIQPKRLHLFDSFLGLPACKAEADLNSPHVKSGVWHPGSCRVLDPKQLLESCKTFLPQERITIYEGWFSDTVKVLSANTLFSVVHIDCDLYSSTMDVLVPLFEKRTISSGATILFDDWNCNQASPAFGERKAWCECVERFKISFSDGGEYGYAAHKFIVHDYRI